MYIHTHIYIIVLIIIILKSGRRNSYCIELHTGGTKLDVKHYPENSSVFGLPFLSEP